MYQPKIKDELIRKLYLRSQQEGKKMTVLLNDLLETALANLEQRAQEVHEPPADAYHAERRTGYANG